MTPNPWRLYRETRFERRWRDGFQDQKRRWRNANDVGQIGLLVADWLRGETEYLPWEVCPRPYKETRDEDGLIELLADLNTAGFITLCSQPATKRALPVLGWSQRAALALLLDAPRLDRIVQTVRDAGLGAQIAQTIPEELSRGSNGLIPVTLQGHRVVTRFGGLDLQSVRTELFEPCSPTMIDTLSGLAHVVIYDPEWGRQTTLWDALRGMLRPDDEDTPG